MSSLPQFNVAEYQKFQSLAASVVQISRLNKEGGDCKSVKFVLATIVGLKNKSIYLWDFKDVDFIFTHFANFKFAYFEIEVSFGLIWVNLQNGRFHLQISILGT